MAKDYTDDLSSLIIHCNIRVKVIGPSECRLKSIRSSNCAFEFTPADLSKGGKMLYIDKHLAYRHTKDLK